VSSAPSSTDPLHPERYFGHAPAVEPPLDAAVQQLSNGWSIRLPVRAEEVRLEKRVVVYEEVEIRREYIEEVEHIDETVRREELNLQTHGSVEATRAMNVNDLRDRP